MKKEISDLIKTIKDSAKEVMEELGSGWQEVIYQSAMEVALREKGITYENQRILPITFADHIIGESIPDLVIWIKVGNKRVALVVDLKAEPGIKEEHQVQVERYIKELRKQTKKQEEVYPRGLVINFVKEAAGVRLKEGFEELDGVQILEVSV